MKTDDQFQQFSQQIARLSSWTEGLVEGQQRIERILMRSIVRTEEGIQRSRRVLDR